MSYISIVANNGFGVMDSWEKVTRAIAHDQLVQVTAQEFEDHQLAEEFAFSRYITRFYLRNRRLSIGDHWQEVNIPLPDGLPCNQIFLDTEYEERELNALVVPPERKASYSMVRDIWNDKKTN